MVVFIILIFWVTLLSYAVSKQFGKSKQKKVYCICNFLALTFVLGLRNQSVGGVDTALVYVPSFNRICDYTLLQTIERHGSKDVLFYCVTKIFTYFCTGSQVYLFVISVIVIACVCVFIYKYSEFPMLSFLLYFALGYYGIAFQMLRHVLAVTVILFSLPALQDKKRKNFILIVILASCFHLSALVFLLAYPLAHLKIGVKQWGAIAICFIACFALEDIIRMLLNMLFSAIPRFSFYIARESALPLTPFLILLVVYTTSFLLSSRSEREDDLLKVCFNMSALSCCSMCFVVFVGEFHRVSMFFGMFNLILLPDVLKRYCVSRSGKILMLFAIYSVLIGYFLLFGLSNSSLDMYLFCWES